MKRYFSLFFLSGLLILFACATKMPDQPVKEKATAEPGIHRITPVRPISELLPAALAAKPPVERGNFRHSHMVDLEKLNSTMKFDIRYATSQNILGTPLYSEARAFMQLPAARALVRINRALAAEGYGLLIFDAYRPWHITQLFWDAVPLDQHQFVADPAVGSRHNRGCAVDLSLYDLKTGNEVVMPSMYDETTERAYPTYQGGTPEQRHLRDMLRRYMEAGGYTVNEYEWWHFDYKDWPHYAIQNERFPAKKVKKN